MPTYDYKCQKCGLLKEDYQSKYHNHEDIICGYCDISMKKQVSKPSVHFKGSGFYETDYKGK